MRVQNLLARPETLMTPWIALRVFMAARRSSARNTESSTPDDTGETHQSEMTGVVVHAKEQAADGVVLLSLRAPDGRVLPPWTPGAHVDLVLDGAPTRQYSLCGDPAQTHEYRLAVLREPNGGGGSLYVHDQLAVGQTGAVCGPRNHFRFAEAPEYLFIAGGIGITPILPMVAAAEAAGTPWRLVYGGRSRASMAFLDELAGYGDKITLWPQDERGMLPLGELLAQPQPGTAVYCCGPEPLLAAVEKNCQSWPEGAVHVERFAPRDQTEPVRREAFDVVLRRSDRTVLVPPDRSILSALADAGVGVPSSCSEGTCGSCETPVLDGVPDHRDSVLSEQERRRGDCMMICVSRSNGPQLVLDL
jgi:ferredoxin-NADP reductase